MFNSDYRNLLRIVSLYDDWRANVLSAGLNFIILVSRLPIPSKAQALIVAFGIGVLVAAVKFAQRMIASQEG